MVSADVLPLAGIRVLDLSRWISGPHAAMVMGDMGAEVVKVETPKGDPARLSPPLIAGESTYFMALNRNKRGLVMDFRNPTGFELLTRLIEKADVLIENFRPGTLNSMGLSPERLVSLNRGLITLSISGYGQDGPRSGDGCFDSVAQAASGLQFLTGHDGDAPVRAGFYVADYSASLYGTIGVLLALMHRERSGEGQTVDIALVESLLSMSATLVPGYFGAGVVPTRLGNRNAHAAPADAFETADGYVQLSASTDALFRALALAMGREDLVADERFATNAQRLKNVDALTREISDWTSNLVSRDVVSTLSEARVPAAIVSTIEDLAEDEQLRSRGAFRSIPHPVAGETKFVASPLRLSGLPARGLRPSPKLGEHTDEVLREWLDAAPHDVATLRRRGAFGDPR